MATPLNDQAQTRLALASLFVALARTLGEQDKSFPSRFEANVEKGYREISDGPFDAVGAMEALRWAREMMKNS